MVTAHCESKALYQALPLFSAGDIGGGGGRLQVPFLAGSSWSLFGNLRIKLRKLDLCWLVIKCSSTT